MKKKTLAVLLLACLVMVQIILSGCGASSSSGGSDKSTETAEQAEQTDQAAQAEQTEPAPSDDNYTGELLYSGTSSATDLESITVSFILSEDKTTIHDYTIQVENFKGSADIPGARVTVELKGTTTTVASEITVDYEGENKNIPVGSCTIESLQFAEDGTAEMVFTYCFRQTTPNEFEIPVPGIEFVLTSEPAPASE